MKDLENGKLSILERVAYGSGNFSNALVFTLISTYLVYYYTNVIGLSAGIIGTIMLVSRFFDGVTDIAMGYIVDRTKSPKGKGRVWILRICIPYAIACILLFAVPNTTTMIQYIYVFISYNLVNSVLYTALAVPYNSLGCLITDNSYERGLLGIATFVGSAASSVFVNAMIMNLVANFGGGESAWTKAVAIFAVFGMLVHLFCYAFTKERVVAMDVEKSDNISFKEGFISLAKNKYWYMFMISDLFLWIAVTMGNGGTTYYAQYVIGDVQQSGTILNVMNIVQLIFLFIAAGFIKKVGKGRSYLIGMVLMVVGSLVMLFDMKNILIIEIGAALKGMGTGIGAGCMLGMMADIVDYSEQQTGIRATGIGSAAMSFAQKVAGGVGGAILGWVLEAGGFDGKLAVQSASAITSVEISYVIIPLVCLVIAALCVIKFDVEKKLVKSN